MRKISFADDAIPDIIRGRKVQTLRWAEDDFLVGELLRLVGKTGSPAGYLRIVSKDHIPFCEISKRDAAAHNWKSVKQLRDRLLTFYPTLTAVSILTRYRFRFQGL